MLKIQALLLSFVVVVSACVQAGVHVSNPATGFPCADPGIFDDTSRTGFYYLACSGNDFPIWQSRDFQRWRKNGNRLMPGGLAPWAETGKSWAPDLAYINGRYVGYVTQKQKHGTALGNIAATSSRDIGKPFIAERKPLIEDLQSCGFIDPAHFFDPVSRRDYLLYKYDGNACGADSKIIISQLSPDGLSLSNRLPMTVVDEIELLDNKPAKHWVLQIAGELGLVESVTTRVPGRILVENEEIIEGPAMIHRNGFYYLFYSKGDWRTDYHVKVARSSNLFGPYRGERTVLKAKPGGRFRAPGHGTFFREGNDFYYVYHAFPDNRKKRFGMLDKVNWQNGWPVINNGYPSE